MKALILTNPGCEEITAQEIKDLDARIISQEEGLLVIDSDEEKLFQICYTARSLSKVVLLLDNFEFEDDPIDQINKIDFKKWLDGKAATICERTGEHNFTSFDIQMQVNKHLQELGAKIEHKHPETIIFILIKDNQCYVGIDLSGVDLGRRDYRIFIGKNSIKGNIAFSMLKYAGYEPKHTLVDPFCRDGIIPIEAALFATNKSPHKFDKQKFAFTKIPAYKNINFEKILTDSEKEFKGEIFAADNNFKYVQSARKNSKIANVIKEISFTRQDLQFLDAKFKKATVDRIITQPLQPGKSVAEKLYEKVIHQLFYQAEFILKKDGKIAVCTRGNTEIIKKEAKDFKLEQERTIKQGQEELKLLVFCKA